MQNHHTSDATKGVVMPAMRPYIKKENGVCVVRPASPPRTEAMGTLGKAANMLIRQYAFPSEYCENLDQLLSKFHDELFVNDKERMIECFCRHTRLEPQGDFTYDHLDTWLNRATDEQIMEFLKDVLKAKKSVDWTGYRILGSIDGSGWPVWTLQLFSKHPETATVVYTGEDAPNISRC